MGNLRPSLAEILAARDRIADLALRTPLVPLVAEDSRAEIHLKLENLQPIGSFKLRGAGNALRTTPPADLREGVYTASAGNMAQGVAWCARQLGVPCRVVVPEHAPATKIDAIERLGGEVIRVPFDAWWSVICTHEHAGVSGHFIHPVCDRSVIAGNGTIGLEIFEDLPDVDAVVVPYGGGGLVTGIASALRELRPGIRFHAAEVETAAPLAASLAAGKPTEIDHQPSFVDGIGGKNLLEEMWPLVSELITSSLVVSLADIAGGVRFLAERHRVVAEGAGAASLAAALSGGAGPGKIVCVISGGNIDPVKLATILGGGVP